METSRGILKYPGLDGPPKGFPLLPSSGVVTLHSVVWMLLWYLHRFRIVC
jgi:hypothetical protein